MYRLTRGIFRVCVALAALGAAWTVEAQPPSGRAPFRVASELVVIDLVAVDSSGRFISDLRPEEIDLRENGRRQQVQLLRLVGRDPGEVPPAAPIPSSVQGGSPARASGLAEPTDDAPRRLIIVIDAVSLPLGTLARIREMLLEALEGLPDGVPVMLATIGPDLIVRQPFTRNREALLAAVSALSPQPNAPVATAAIFDAVDRICAAAIDPQRVVRAAIEEGERVILDANARSVGTSSALADLLTRISAIGGRKHLVFYSAGHALSPSTHAMDAVVAAASSCAGIDQIAIRREASGAF